MSAYSKSNPAEEPGVDASEPAPLCDTRGRAHRSSGGSGTVLDAPHVHVDKLRNALRCAQEQLAGVRWIAEDLDWKYKVAQAEAERWRLACREARRACDLMSQRREALIEGLPQAVSNVLAVARMAAWEEGRLAGQAGASDKRLNPYAVTEEVGRA